MQVQPERNLPKMMHPPARSKCHKAQRLRKPQQLVDTIRSPRSQFQVGFVQQRLTFPAVFGLNQRLQQLVERPLQAFAKNKTMLPWKTAGVVATPQDQVVGLGDDDQFVLLFYVWPPLRCQRQAETQTVKMTCGDFTFRPPAAGEGLRG